MNIVVVKVITIYLRRAREIILSFTCVLFEANRVFALLHRPNGGNRIKARSFYQTKLTSSGCFAGFCHS